MQIINLSHADRNSLPDGLSGALLWAANEQDAIAALDADGPCLLLIGVEHLNMEFLQEVKAKNPLCGILLTGEQAECSIEQPYLFQGFLDGFYRQPDGRQPAPHLSKMDDILRDMLSMEYIYDLIYGHLERLQKIHPILEYANIDVHPQIILTIMLDDFWNLCKDLHNRLRYRLKRVVLNSARTAMEPDIPGVATTLVGTDKIVIALNCGARRGAQAERYAEDCAERIKSFILADTGISSSVGISNYCEDPMVLWRAYEQSFQALSGSFRQGQGQALRYQHRAEDRSGALRPPIRESVKQDILVALSKNSYASCKHAVGRLTRSLVSAHADAAQIKALSVTLLSEIAQYCIRLGLDSVQVWDKATATTAEIFQASTIQGIESHMLLFLADLIQQKNSAFPDGDKRMITLAKAYIGQSYDSPLTLPHVAALFGYSPPYFSRRFKAHAKINFSQYLSQVRIDSAKKLLTNPKLSIDEIAIKTGFQSRSYFSSTFKRITGETPRQFRLDTHPDEVGNP